MPSFVRCMSLACAFLAAASTGLAAQTGTISGQIVDARSRAPIPSAQISIAALGAGALTQANGRFIIPNLPVGTHTVEVALIGYSRVSQEVVVESGQTTVVNLTLSEQAVSLDEVVVTGTAGGAQRRALGQSVGRIDVSEVIETAPVREMQNMLQGRVPGAFVRQASGVLGEGPDIAIRGLKSLSLGANPLIYVDGIRVANGAERLEDLNLLEVESLEVVKGPAAATLYGTEAAAGVIQIITKRGQQGAPRFNFQLTQGSMWIHDPASYYRTAYRRLDDGTLDSLHLYRQEQALGLDPYTYGHIQNFQAEVSGGTDLIRYYLSAALDDNQGFTEVNNEKNWSARANTSIVPNERLSLNMNLGLVTGRLGTLSTGGTNSTIGGGLHRGRPQFKGTSTRGWPTLTAREQYDYLKEYRDTDKFTASLQVTHNPLTWLEQRLTFGADLSSVVSSDLTPIVEDEDLRGRIGNIRDGSASKSRSYQRNVTLDYGATAIVDLSEPLRTRTSAGLQYFLRTSESLSASGQAFPAPGLSTVGSTSRNRTGSDGFSEVASVGVFVQEELQWNNRLFLTAAIRADDNSAFGEDFSIVAYPKFSASWVISEEPFFSVAAIDQLRLRSAYGASGRAPAVNSALRTYSPATGRGDAPVVEPNSVGNPDLKPERGSETEVGFDLGMFGGRLGLDFTAYHQRIDDVIIQRINAPSNGFPGTQRINAGRVDSKGFETALTGQLASSLDLHASVSYLDNKIVHMGGLPPVVINNHASGPMHVAGFAPASQFVRIAVSADFDENYHAINMMCDGGTGPDGKGPGGPPVPCEEAPTVYAGNVTPPWEGAFGATWRPIQRLSLAAGFGWTKGSIKFNQNRWAASTSYRVGEENVFPERFTPVEIASAENGASLAINNFYIEDNSYLRLRELSLSYALPENFLRLGSSTGSVTVGMRNVKTWTGYSGGDPENLNSGPTDGGRIDDTGGIPTPMSLTVTLRLGY